MPFPRSFYCQLFKKSVLPHFVISLSESMADMMEQETTAVVEWEVLKRVEKRLLTVERMKLSWPWATSLISALMDDLEYASMPKRTWERRAGKVRSIIRNIEEFLIE